MDQQTDLSRPMTVSEWAVTIFISVIPIVGIVMLFVWAFGAGNNVNKTNWAKGMLIIFAAGVVLWILLLVFGIGCIGMWSGSHPHGQV